MARLKGEPYDSARELFETTCTSGARRCQCFAKSKLSRLRDRYGDDLSGITPGILAGAQCGAPARGGNAACYHHGAGSLTKPGGRPIVHGYYSQDMPKNLLERFERALSDPELIQLRSEMAMVVSLISDVLAKYEDMAPDMKELGDAMTTLGQALKADDITEAQACYLVMYEVFRASKGQWAILHEITSLIETRRKLSATEVRRLEALNQMLTVQQAMAFQAAVLHIVRGALDKVESITCPHCSESLAKTWEIANVRTELIDEFRKLATRTTRTIVEGSAI